MKKIEIIDPHRKKHFDFFRKMDQPHFNVCAPVDITEFLRVIKERERRFTTAMVYVISKTANDIPEFRQRIRGEEIVEHTAVHPSFTLRTAASDVFSFCTVPYQTDFPAFDAEAGYIMAQMQEAPSLEDEEGRDDYLFLSAFPWVSFTSMMHAMHYSPADSVPRIVWGKYYTENGRTKMPLGVQAHHALVDGAHLGKYFELIAGYLHDPAWMEG